PVGEEGLGRDDERLEGYVAGLAEGEGDLLRVAVLDGLAAAGQDGGGVVGAAEDQRAAGRDGQAAALGGGQLRRLAGAGKGDGLQGLVGPALVEERGRDDGRAGGLEGGLGDDDDVLGLDVADGRGRVVRLDLEGLGVVAGRARGERGDRERDGGGGEGTASKAAAHGGGNSLDSSVATGEAALSVCQRPQVTEPSPSHRTRPSPERPCSPEKPSARPARPGLPARRVPSPGD